MPNYKGAVKLPIICGGVKYDICCYYFYYFISHFTFYIFTNTYNSSNNQKEKFQKIAN